MIWCQPGGHLAKDITSDTEEREKADFVQGQEKLQTLEKNMGSLSRDWGDRAEPWALAHRLYKEQQ